jgi:hypothetical protein
VSHTEHDEQVALFKWIALHKTRYPELECAFAVPNGGLRDDATAAKLKAEGVQPGVPDVCIAVPRIVNGRLYHGLFIELKWGRGRPSDEQREWIARLSSQGYLAVCVWGWQPAVGAISEYLGIEAN